MKNLQKSLHDTKNKKLRLALSQKLPKEKILEFSQTINSYNRERIFSFTTETDKELSANAAHILLKAKGENTIWLAGKIPAIMEIIQNTPHEKTKRLLLSILEKQKIDPANINTSFLDYCLKNITSIKTPLAIKVLCMKLAYKQSTAYPELLSELKNTLEITDNSMLNPSTLCAKKKLLKAINHHLSF